MCIYVYNYMYTHTYTYTKRNKWRYVNVEMITLNHFLLLFALPCVFFFHCWVFFLVLFCFFTLKYLKWAFVYSCHKQTVVSMHLANVLSISMK